MKLLSFTEFVAQNFFSRSTKNNSKANFIFEAEDAELDPDLEYVETDEEGDENQIESEISENPTPEEQKVMDDIIKKDDDKYAAENEQLNKKSNEWIRQYKDLKEREANASGRNKDILHDEAERIFGLLYNEYLPIFKRWATKVALRFSGQDYGEAMGKIDDLIAVADEMLTPLVIEYDENKNNSTGVSSFKKFIAPNIINKMRNAVNSIRYKSIDIRAGKAAERLDSTVGGDNGEWADKEQSYYDKISANNLVDTSDLARDPSVKAMNSEKMKIYHIAVDNALSMLDTNFTVLYNSLIEKFTRDASRGKDNGVKRLTLDDIGMRLSPTQSKQNLTKTYIPKLYAAIRAELLKLLPAEEINEIFKEDGASLVDAIANKELSAAEKAAFKGAMAEALKNVKINLPPPPAGASAETTSATDGNAEAAEE